MDYSKLDKFKSRLEKIGIETEYAGNFPWIYLTKVNDKDVKEKQYSNHRFTVFLMDWKTDKVEPFKDLRNTFRVIKKYVEESNV